MMTELELTRLYERMEKKDSEIDRLRKRERELEAALKSIADGEFHTDLEAMQIADRALEVK